MPQLLVLLWYILLLVSTCFATLEIHKRCSVYAMTVYTVTHTSYTIGLKGVRSKPDKPDMVVQVLPLNITGTIQDISLRLSSTNSSPYTSTIVPLMACDYVLT